MSARGRREPPATITETDHLMFTCGDCHMLALELHRRTNWPLWAFYTADTADALPDLHSFVQDPDNLFLDVAGRHTGPQLVEEWSYADERWVLHPVTDLDAFARAWPPVYPESKERVQQVASLLLEHFYPSLQHGRQNAAAGATAA